MLKRRVIDIAQISKTSYKTNKRSQRVDAEQATARNKKIGRKGQSGNPNDTSKARQT